ncbi:dessication-induced 1VOC superfamily protein, partial [Trifolium medium]|nr:dessication-induced 1VOC superfamily protein [Trifolium medium]
SSNLNPAFAYTVVYVKDVAESVDFYAKAFGYSVRRLDESHRWGELESGHTTIAFTPIHQHETDDLTGVVHANRSKQERPPLEVCFVYPDVDAAYKSSCRHSVGVTLNTDPDLLLSNNDAVTRSNQS